MNARLGLALSLLAVAFNVVAAPVKNGFDLAGALVPADEILSGGPPKDGIPAIDQPRFVSARDATFLKDDAGVLGIRRNGVGKAYPIAILNWHEIVNDDFAGLPVAVTFCPLCGTGMAFLATIGGKRLSFGVSGLLYNSDVLLYDRQTQSLWPQLMTQAVTGPFKGTRLESVVVSHTTWGDWKKRESGTLVLSPETGYSRDYTRNPYAGYEKNSEILFRLRSQSARYHPKERVIGIEIGGRFKAYPFIELAKTPGEVRDIIAGRPVIVRFDAAHQTGAVFDAAGKELPSVIAFWFAWYAFHNNTEVFRAK